MIYDTWCARTLQNWKPGSSKFGEASCPQHEDSRPSLSVDRETGGYNCHSPKCPCPRGHLRKLAETMGLSTVGMPERQARPLSDSQEDIYQDPSGKDLLKVRRYVKDGNKGFAQYHKSGAEWEKGGVKVNPLLHAPKLAQPGQQAVFVVEGEKAARAGNSIGYLTTTAPEGAGKAHKVGTEYWRLLAPHTVYLLPDNDEPGRKHMEDVGRILAGLGISSRTLILPGLPPKGDLADFVRTRTREQAREEIRALCRAPQAVQRPPANEEKPSADANLTTDGDRLKALVEGLQLFTDGGVGHALLPTTGRRSSRVVRVQDPAFRRYLVGKCHELYEKGPSDAALRSAMDYADYRADQGEEKRVWLRVAIQGPAAYLHLGNSRVVEIGVGGWKILDQSPVPFREPVSSQVLPDPVRGGGIAELRPFLNVSDRDFIKLVAWLLGCLRPLGALPILNLNGDQSGGKTTIGRFLRQLIDPNRALMQMCKESARDLALTCEGR